MLKLTGAVMIIATATYWGWTSAKRLRLRAVTLRQLETALSYMGREVGERLAPLPEVISELCRCSQGKVQLFFRQLSDRLDSGQAPFSQAWQNAIGDGGDLLLQPPELSVLLELDPVLGRYSAPRQNEAIGHAMARMGEFAALAEAADADRSKLLVTAGMCSGIFAVILLL